MQEGVSAAGAGAAVLFGDVFVVGEFGEGSPGFFGGWCGAGGEVVCGVWGVVFEAAECDVAAVAGPQVLFGAVFGCVSAAGPAEGGCGGAA